jgi:hypothetical protein
MNTPEARPRPEDIFLPVYLALALPFGALLYFSTFEQGRSFLDGQTWLSPLQRPAVTFAGIALVGAWALGTSEYRSRRWLAAGWLALSSGTAAGLAQAPHVGVRTAAWVLCLPALVMVPLLAASAYRHADKPVGAPGAWARVAVGLWAAAVLSGTSSAAYALWAFPLADRSPPGVLTVTSCAASLVTVITLPASILGAALAHACRSGRAALGLIGLALALAISLILLNGLTAVEVQPMQLGHLLYILAIAAPIAAWLCQRIASAGDTLAAGLASAAGRSRSGATLAVHLGLGLGALVLVGRLHFEFAWGFRTAPLYSTLGLVAACWLIASLPRPGRVVVVTVAFLGAVLGLARLVPPSSRRASLAASIRFDNNLGSMVRFRYHARPRGEPVLARLRALFDRSHALATMVPRRRPQLTLRPVARRPNVFFVIVDALRRQTYSGSAEHRRRYPGLAWMSSRFVAYDNAWSSYNGTVGSVPALLAGAYNPAFYDVVEEAQGDNVLLRAARLSGYRCHDISDGGVETRRAWGDCAPLTPAGGVGKEDPEVIFPAVLRALDAHLETSPAEPAFFYIHLFNMHQPLLPRADVPLDGRGQHWMKTLYEHNAAHLDRHLQRWLEGLDARGLLDDALVVITSDHGEEVFDYGGLYHGWQINPAIAAVPLLVHYPAGYHGAPAPGQSLERAVNLIDVAPTICEVMGASLRRESTLQGVSLLAPAPARRSFPLLSWKTRALGRVETSPPRLLALDAESGAVQTFRPGEDTWRPVAEEVEALRLADELGGDLAELVGEPWSP